MLAMATKHPKALAQASVTLGHKVRSGKEGQGLPDQAPMPGAAASAPHGTEQRSTTKGAGRSLQAQGAVLQTRTSDGHEPKQSKGRRGPTLNVGPDTVNHEATAGANQRATQTQAHLGAEQVLRSRKPQGLSEGFTPKWGAFEPQAASTAVLEPILYYNIIESFRSSLTPMAMHVVMRPRSSRQKG